MKFKLHDFFGGAIDRLCIVSREQGGYTNTYYTFLPGKIYETNDPVFIQYLKGEIGDVLEKRPVTQALQAELDDSRIAYTIHKCSTCPTAKPQLWFNPFEFVEDK